MRKDMPGTRNNMIAKIIRKGGTVFAVALFALNECAASGLHGYFWFAAVIVIAALVGFVRARMFSRSEHLFGLIIFLAAVASKLFLHPGDGTVELIIPWFVIMCLWSAVQACSPEKSRSILRSQPTESGARPNDDFEYRPGPDGISGYYRNGTPIKFD